MATTPVATDNKAQNNGLISADNLGDCVGMPGVGTSQAGPDFVGSLFSWMALLGFGQNEGAKKEEKKDDEKKDAKESEKESKGTTIRASTEADKPSATQSALGLSLGADKFNKKIDDSIERNRDSARRIGKDSRDLDRQLVAAETGTVYLPEVRHFHGSPASSSDKS